VSSKVTTIGPWSLKAYTDDALSKGYAAASSRGVPCDAFGDVSAVRGPPCETGPTHPRMPLPDMLATTASMGRVCLVAAARPASADAHPSSLPVGWRDFRQAADAHAEMGLMPVCGIASLRSAGLRHAAQFVDLEREAAAAFARD
jgi:hypothetical protein